MNGVYLIDYAVNGIKNIDKMVSLSFYKKTINRNFNVQGYNLKGIYGTNGAGKTGIIVSVRILKRLLTEQNYLNNPVIQNELHELINRKTKELEIDVRYLLVGEKIMFLFNYSVKIGQSSAGTYEIEHEVLTRKSALSAASVPVVCYETKDGTLITHENDEYSKYLTEQTKNLLSNATLTSIILNKELTKHLSAKNSELTLNILSLILFGKTLYIYSDQGDDHSSYHLNNYLGSEDGIINFDMFVKQIGKLSGRNTSAFTTEPITVRKDSFSFFEKRINRLYEFLHIFKDDLQGIYLDRKDNGDNYICSLVLNYGDYAVNAEFESTGIKKLIRLYDYLDKMVQGSIVFIDELDSNLHDVYLCALLEYLMENAKGQLCFTTHNVGPMDILKKNKKSIDFLSEDHVIYPWVTSGNYSPANLYKKGMIEGSPFNIFPFEFIKAFYIEGDDE